MTNLTNFQKNGGNRCGSMQFVGKFQVHGLNRGNVQKAAHKLYKLNLAQLLHLYPAVHTLPLLYLQRCMP